MKYKIEEFYDKIGKTVKITCDNGNIISGVIDSIYNEDGCDQRDALIIEPPPKTYLYEILVDEIADIEYLD